MRRYTFRMRIAFAVLVTSLAAGSAWAERTQVYSIQGADCGSCGDKIKAELKKVKGIKKTAFDVQKVELTVKMDDSITDRVVQEAVERTGMKAIVGPGQGSYVAFPEYPAGADVARLTGDGSAVGPLEKLRVPGKYTVFDIYADWCGPCRLIDERLREIVAERQDVAIRKLNVVNFDSPLAKELGDAFSALPYVVVFTPSGKRDDISGVNLIRLGGALSEK
jgi:thiol-disulfide isomerase/thioredoxin